MNIVRLLELRSAMILHDIKNVLDCNISTTYEFGYPNLFAIINAYTDIFNVSLGATQERSEITLVANTECKY